jgi:hypothetical protein
METKDEIDIWEYVGECNKVFESWGFSMLDDLEDTAVLDFKGVRICLVVFDKDVFEITPYDIKTCNVVDYFSTNDDTVYLNDIECVKNKIEELKDKYAKIKER